MLVFSDMPSEAQESKVEGAQELDDREWLSSFGCSSSSKPLTDLKRSLTAESDQEVIITEVLLSLLLFFF